MFVDRICTTFPSNPYKLWSDKQLNYAIYG